MHFQPDKYGPVLAELIDLERPTAIGQGTPNRAVREALAAVSLESAFGHQRLTDRDMGLCCLSGLWLHHDYLDRSHDFSQQIHTPEGSFWHGIMHRREGDYSNAKYWFRQVGDHPVYHDLSLAVAELDQSPNSWRRESGWDPSDFVDVCREAARGEAGRRKTAEQLTQAEWQLLFDFCYDQAT